MNSQNLTFNEYDRIEPLKIKIHEQLSRLSKCKDLPNDLNKLCLSEQDTWTLKSIIKCDYKQSVHVLE
jgi:hypothetical protein